MANHLKIGEIARRVRVNPKTIRYYEGIGLLPKAARNDSGYRVYSQKDLSSLQFIRRAKLLGLTLTETRGLFQYAALEQCGQLQRQLVDLLERKLREVDERIADLTAFKNDLLGVHRDLLQRLEQDASPSPSPSVGCDCLSDEAHVSDAHQSIAGSIFPRAREGQNHAGKEVTSMASEKGDLKSKDNKEANGCGCGCVGKNAKK